MEVVAVCKAMKMIRSITLYCMKGLRCHVRNRLVFFGDIECILPVRGVALVYPIVVWAKKGIKESSWRYATSRLYS